MLSIRFIRNTILDITRTFIDDDGLMNVETTPKHIKFGEIYHALSCIKRHDNKYDIHFDGSKHLGLDGVALGIEESLFEIKKTHPIMISGCNDCNKKGQK